jgi:uncharacterized repeat protein (TIGR01451 family)
MNNATTGTTTIPGPIDEDITPASGLNIGTGAIDGNSVSDRYTVYKGADLTRTIKVGNNGLSYNASSTTAYTAAVVNIPICTNEVVELDALYKVTATSVDLLDECIAYKLQVASNVGFTTDVETFTQANDPKFAYTITTPGTKFFRFWLDCDGTNAAVTNTQIIQFTATDCPTNTTAAIADLNACAGVAQSVTVETTTPTVSKFFWVVNPYGKVYANAPTAQTTLTRTISFTPANDNESGVWKTYVTNATGNSVLNAIIKSVDYYDGSAFNTNGGSADLKKGTAFTTTKFIKLNAVSLIGATGDATATSGFNIKLFAKNGELLYTQAGASVNDNSALQIALTNWFIPPGDYIIALDEATVGSGITGAIANVAISGPVKFPNTATPSITIQGGVENELDFDNADVSVANYFVDWDFTELCSSQEPNRTFNFAVIPTSCCTVPVLPTYTIAASTPSNVCGTRTYTVTFNNATGAAVNNLKFSTALDPGQSLVDSSISNLFGGITNPDPYASEPNFSIEGMTLPTGTSTLTFDVDVTTISLEPNNLFTLENDCPTTKRTVIFPTPICKVCENGKTKLSSGSAWNVAGTTGRTSNSISNVALVGTPLSGALRADITVTYPANVEYAPSSYPRKYSSLVQLTRRDNLNAAAGLVSYKVNLKDTLNVPTAAKPSFSISGINKISGQSVRVKVVGRCGVDTVKPRLSNAYTKYPTRNSYIINENEAFGTKYETSTSIYGTVNVVFDKPVTEVVVEWTVDRTPIRSSYSSLFVSEMNFECNSVVPEVLSDNIYLQAYFEEDDILTCIDAKVKLKVTNLNCDARTLNITNSLPASLEYVAESYAGVGDEEPIYTGQSFNLSNFEVPSGISYVYVNVKPTNVLNSGTYNTLFNYSVVGGVNDPNPYRSDDNSGSDGYQDATIQYTASSILSPKPEVVITADKNCFEVEGDTIAYTITFTNNSGSVLNNVLFSNDFESNQIYVDGISSNPLGGIVVLLDSSTILIDSMVIPIGVSTLKYRTYAFVVDSIVKVENSNQIVVDPESDCSKANTIYSNLFSADTAYYYPGLTTGTPKSSNVGITTLNIHKPNPWPSGINNAWIALESRTKGFVITRTTPASIPSPIEGMLIYDTTDKCFKLYSETIWKCISRQCKEN